MDGVGGDGYFLNHFAGVNLSSSDDHDIVDHSINGCSLSYLQTNVSVKLPCPFRQILSAAEASGIRQTTRSYTI